MSSRLPIMLAALFLAAAPALAQDKQPQGTPDAKPAAAEPAKPEWPKSVEKKLWAEDVRGKPAPEFVIEKVLNGKEPERKGKVVLIDFWATWCPPCRALIPELNEFHDKFKDDLVIIGVSGEKQDDVEKFKKDNEFRYTCAIDTQERMSKAVKVEGIPHVLIISTDGIVRWQGFPLSEEEPLTADIIKQVIDADPGVQARHEKEAAEAAKKENAKDKDKAREAEPEQDQTKPGEADVPAPSNKKPSPDKPAQPANPR